MTYQQLLAGSALMACCLCVSVAAQAQRTPQQADIAREAGKAVIRLERAAQAADAIEHVREGLHYLARLFQEIERHPQEVDNGKALYRLGHLFEHGADDLGLVPDTFEAIKWYRKAAGHQHAQAQYNLGMLYLLEARKGVSSPQSSYREAAWWFTKAAEQNEPMAKFILAILHLEGVGVLKKNEAEADKWLEALRKNGGQSSKQELLESLKAKPFVEWDFDKFRK